MDEARTKSDLLYDPQEDDPAFAKLLEAAVEEVSEMLWKEDREKLPGMAPEWWDMWAPQFPRLCHEVKAILRERHGLDWKTPQEMNPQVWFD